MMGHGLAIILYNIIIYDDKTRVLRLNGRWSNFQKCIRTYTQMYVLASA